MGDAGVPLPPQCLFLSCKETEAKCRPLTLPVRWVHASALHSGGCRCPPQRERHHRCDGSGTPVMSATSPSMTGHWAGSTRLAIILNRKKVPNLRHGSARATPIPHRTGESIAEIGANIAPSDPHPRPPCRASAVRITAVQRGLPLSKSGRTRLKYLAKGIRGEEVV